MEYILVIDHDKCILCRYCEIVCSYALTGEFNPEVSVIKEIKIEKHRVDKLRCNVPPRCLEEPRCVKACDQRALTYYVATKD